MKFETGRLVFRVLTVGLFAFITCSANASDFAHYEKLANDGDVAAMTELALRYHQGTGVTQNYQKAYDWYLKAIEKGDGDALNNIGVMHRDGLGVPKNEKIAYLLFLAVHMESLGDESTQMRANRNLRRAMKELPQVQLHEALSYTWPYVVQILKSRGKDLKPSPGVLPAKDRPRIRDNGWWIDSERAAMKFESPTPWDKPGT
ncbi:MAG: sel1 repeat family protein [Opitutae bacterium]|nr:sel1 repeat family protein [Opitutae bacterium]